MPKVTVVLGLCGSGKSHALRELAGQGFEPFDEGVVPGWTNWEPLLEAIRQGKNCAVVEIAYRVKANRQWLQAQVVAIDPNVKLTWICFENDLATANSNCERDMAKQRDVAGNLRHNAEWTLDYTYPTENVELRPIHRLP